MADEELDAPPGVGQVHGLPLPIRHQLVARFPLGVALSLPANRPN